MKAVFAAAALFATLAAPAAFAGVRNDPHPMKESAPAQPVKPASTKTVKSAKPAASSTQPKSTTPAATPKTN